MQQIVYIVDDNADYRFLVGQVFNRFLKEYTVHFFESGTALTGQFQPADTETPCLVLLDGHMPELSGIETLALLRQRPYWQKVPMVIVSSSTSVIDQQNAYAAGASSYLIKPTDLLSLRDNLTVLCQRWITPDCTSRAV